MDPLTAANASELQLVSALDVISIHPENNDVNESDDEAREVIAITNNPLSHGHIFMILYIFKNELLKDGETLPPRAPRGLFMGPVRKPRRKRGARSTQVNEIPLKNSTSKPNNGNLSTSQSNSSTNVNHNEVATTSNSTGASKPKIGDHTQLTLKSIGNSGAPLPFNDGKINGKPTTGGNKPGTPKRPRSNQNSPGNMNRPKKPKTLAQVVSNDLKLFIANPPDGIKEDQLAIMEGILMVKLNEFLESNPAKAPTFESAYRNGALRMNCSDQFSANWLREAIKGMIPPWNNAKIIVGTFEEVFPERKVKRPTIRFFIPNGLEKPKFEAVAKKLQLQNPPLDTSSWIPWKMDVKEEGIYYHVTIEETDLATIKSKQSRLFYCFTKIRINLPTAPKGEDAEAKVDEKCKLGFSSQ